VNRHEIDAALKAQACPLALIRATHPDSYQSGQWGWITGLTRTLFGDQDCWEVLWPSGPRDLWLADDSGEPAAFRHGYEYLMISSGHGQQDPPELVARQEEAP
jgi:hypothetical protein